MASGESTGTGVSRTVTVERHEPNLRLTEQEEEQDKKSVSWDQKTVG